MINITVLILIKRQKHHLSTTRHTYVLTPYMGGGVSFPLSEGQSENSAVKHTGCV